MRKWLWKSRAYRKRGIRVQSVTEAEFLLNICSAADDRTMHSPRSRTGAQSHMARRCYAYRSFVGLLPVDDASFCNITVLKNDLWSSFRIKLKYVRYTQNAS